MTPAEITLVQNSWRQLRDLDPHLVGDLFYSKLFLDHPELRPLFPKDMTEQQAKLIGKFNIIFARLNHLEDIKEDIAALARRHVGYGVKAEHYGFVGSALLWTLERGLGDDWTSEKASAWQSCYQELSSWMIQCTNSTQ